MEPEVVMNLWVFIQSIGQMQVIHELGVRPYVMRGSDDEMTRLLKALSISDFHFARRFPLPDRYYLEIKQSDGWLRPGTGDTWPQTPGTARKGLALVNPMISGMGQMEYFKEALDVSREIATNSTSGNRWRSDNNAEGKPKKSAVRYYKRCRRRTGRTSSPG